MSTIENFLENLKNKASCQLIEGNQQISSKEFVALIDAKAEFLRAYGVKKRTRVYLPIHRTIEDIVLLFAFLKLQCIVFIGNPTTPTQRLKDILEFISPHFLVCSNVQYQIFLAAGSISLNDSIAFFDQYRLIVSLVALDQLDPVETEADLGIMTSGTTGEPRAILHRLDRILLNAKLHAESIQLTENDRIGIHLPLHFSYGLVASLFGSLIAGLTIYLAPDSIEEHGSWIEKKGFNIFNTTPVNIRRLLNYSLASLAKITIGGDVLDPALALRIKTLYPNLSLYATYGLTEAGPRVFTKELFHSDLMENIIPQGIPLEGISYRIVSGDSSEEGELVLKTPTPMLGYFRKPEDTSEVLIDNEVRTSDLFRLKDNQLFFIGRKKRVICRGGEKIHPVEIENHLLKFEDVIAAWVTGEVDQEFGEIPKAFLVTKTGTVDEKRITHFLRKVLTRSQIPAAFICVPQLPYSAKKK